MTTKLYSLFKNSLLIALTIIASANAGFAQNYGGEIKLKITYNDRPLVGYTITGSINKIDIGGKGVTDSEGNVTLHTDPLPVPNIDVKGVRQCGNAKKEWEASGFVYVSPSNENFYHLRLERVVDQMSEFSGLNIDLIMESFGLNCNGALGGSGSDQNSTGSNTSSSNSNPTPTNNNNSTSIAQDKPKELSASDEMKNDHAEWSAKNDASREKQIAESKQKREDFMSGASAEQGYQNQKNVLTNQITKLDQKISKTQMEAEGKKDGSQDQRELLYDVEEMKIERWLKQNKLDKTNAIIAKGNIPLNGSENRPFDERKDDLNLRLKEVQSKRKKGIPLEGLQSGGNVTQSQDQEQNQTEGSDEGEISYSPDEIKNMSDIKLKSVKAKLNMKLSNKKLGLKSKANIMSMDKKEAMEKEIVSLQNTIDLITNEIEQRKEK